jgi:hypothetical protein
VFDLDDTLLSTANRHLRILREFALAVEPRDPLAAAALRAIGRGRLRYSATRTAEEAGLAPALVPELGEFWRARFFENPYLLEDDPVPGAPGFVRDVAARGARPVYVTGRDEAMRDGTEAALARHGFPAPDGRAATLVLKPTFDTPDLAFKQECMATIAGMGRVAATFENEPAHVNLFAEAFPGARHFLVETQHSGKPVVPHPGAHRIRDFRR